MNAKALPRPPEALFQATWAALHAGAAILHVGSAIYHMRRFCQELR